MNKYQNVGLTKVSLKGARWKFSRVSARVPRLLLNGLTAFSLFCAPAIAQQGQGTTGEKPDNSKRNSANQPTAEDQGGSPQDREMTRNIRRELVQNDSLSTGAKNIKVITENGKVILRGPVGTEEERRKISSLAEQIAGKGNVTNQLEPKER